MANTLAFYNTTKSMTVKSLIVQARVSCTVKSFTGVITIVVFLAAAFGTASYLHPSLIFVGKARSLHLKPSSGRL